MVEGNKARSSSQRPPFRLSLNVTVYKLIFGPSEIFNEYMQKATRPVSFGRKK